jgi:hypothetical protein
MFKISFEYVVKTAEWCGHDRRQMKWIMRREFNLPFPPYVGLSIKSGKNLFTIFELKTGHHELVPLYWDNDENMFKFIVTDVITLADAKALVERLKKEGYYAYREAKESPKEAVATKEMNEPKKVVIGSNP